MDDVDTVQGLVDFVTLPAPWRHHLLRLTGEVDPLALA